MTTVTVLELGRESFGRQAWEAAYSQLSAADRERPLEPEDLERLAGAAHLVGRDSDSADIWARAHHAFLEQGNAPRAARCTFWLCLPFLMKGELAQGGGWIARGRRLLDDGGHDGVERGYLGFAEALRCVFEGNAAAAHSGFCATATIGERFRDHDLLSLARLGQGRTLIRLGQTAQGVTLLDEAMAAVTAGEVSSSILGVIYCSVIDACHEIFDMRRAQEWTSALSQWCAGQPDMAPYRGECLVRRAELMQLHGAWPGAMAEAERARDWFSRPPAHRSIGAAFYQLGELHRLRGESARAEAAYRRASEAGRDPQPGLAQLRLAQGQIDVARTAISRAIEETRHGAVRTRMLPAAVDIFLAAGDVPAARATVDELAGVAAGLDSPFLRAVAAQAAGAVLLAEGDARGALAALRSATATWRDLEAPYDDARARVLIGLACRALADADSAELELDAARQIFQRLGAAPDHERVSGLVRASAPRPAGGLTSRELQVLGLVATGRTNRAIADQLGISEKTVARHVSNIFVKLDVTSRAAATAYAYQQGLVPART